MSISQATWLVFTVCLGFQLVLTIRSHHALRQTNLTSAWVWAILAEIACCVSCLASVMHASPAILDQMWYFTAILMLCPFISVLGARSPTHRVWNWFIIVPLILVLGWPALTLWLQWHELPRLVLQTPVFVGLVLVFVMGIGNYLGTRFSSVSFWLGCSVVWLLAAYRPSPENFGDSLTIYRYLGSVCFIIGVFQTFKQAKRPVLEEERFDRLWFDFRDTFGIVWSIRIQDRINQTAETEKWSARLGPNGFEWQDTINTEVPTSQLTKAETEAKLEHTLRWLFRRFVTPEWIDQRLNNDL